MFSNSITLILPSKTKDNHLINQQAILQEYSIAMSNIFGGSTAVNAKGCYIMQDGTPVFEDVILLTSFTNTTNCSEFLKLVNKLKIELEQESVAYIINNTMYFI